MAAPALVQAQGTRSQARCAGQLVTDVVVRSEGPDYGGAFARSRTLGSLLVRLHTPTSPSVIRNYLLLRKGDRCSALRRSESERLLRAMPFIADATVTAYQDGDGVRLEVVTVDEPSMVGNLGITSEAPWVSRLTLGNANLLGNGVYTSGQWRSGGYYRDSYAMRYTNYQLFERPYQLDLRWARREVGSEWTARVSDPFLTEVQRVAWRVSMGQSSDYSPFRRPDTLAAVLRVKREFMDAGALTRFGPPGRRGLVGLQFSVEDVEPGRGAVVITSNGIVPETVPDLEGVYAPWRSVRLNALLGFRRLRFRRVDGFDALSGSQDLRTGIQVSGTLGRSLPTSRGIARHETFARAESFLGVAWSGMYAAVEAQLEARRRAVTGWEDVLSSGRAAWYVKPHPRHLITADLSWSSVPDARIPVQLALGDRRGGLRGYADSWLAGGTRMVGRLEERWRVASIGGTANAAIGLFTDVGSVVAGDVPLGVSSGMRQSVGASLILAVPAKSQRMWRVDFAFPTDRRDGARFELRLTSEDRTQSFWRVPNDILSARERGVPQSIHRWP
ncbi:MAG: BamA/TamA family outer membrane protein [Gemmatimonadaceae bacterium]|nr:BamA/TamA family outer membrane protein [Gemmatimonadaceae bacterium]